MPQENAPPHFHDGASGLVGPLLLAGLGAAPPLAEVAAAVFVAVADGTGIKAGGGTCRVAGTVAVGTVGQAVAVVIGSVGTEPRLGERRTAAVG